MTEQGEQRIVDESTIDRKLHHNVATAFQIQSQTKPAATRNTDTKSKVGFLLEVNV